MNEIRNELLLILKYTKAKEEDKKIQLMYLLERFENSLNQKKQDLEYQLEEVKSNLETLKYVREEIMKEGIKNETN